MLDEIHLEDSKTPPSSPRCRWQRHWPSEGLNGYEKNKALTSTNFTFLAIVFSSKFFRVQLGKVNKYINFGKCMDPGCTGVFGGSWQVAMTWTLWKPQGIPTICGIWGCDSGWSSYLLGILSAYDSLSTHFAGSNGRHPIQLCSKKEINGFLMPNESFKTKSHEVIRPHCQRYDVTSMI